MKSRLKTAAEIAKWLESTALYIWRSDRPCMSWMFIDPYDHDLALAIGWLSGYDKDTKSTSTEMKSRSEPTCALNAELILFNPADSSDIEFATMPYNRKGDVWNTGNTLMLDSSWKELADYYLKEYKAMVRERRKRGSEWVFDL